MGKTTLIYQTVKYLIEKKVSPQKILYLPLDHPSVSGKSILEIIETTRQANALSRNDKMYVFLGEIQFLPNWEQEAKAIVDFENIKLVISGSASTKILSKGTFLTGRTLSIVVNPLDFSEFIHFRKLTIGKTDTALRENLLRKYLQTGGYPEYVENQNPLYFSDLVTNIVNKDIAGLFPVKNPALVSQLLSLIADRTGSMTSFTKLGEIMDLTKDTIRDYLYYLSSTFIVNDLGKFSSSRNASLYSPRKFYPLDTGLLFNLTGKLNLGAAAETVVFHKLSKKYKKIGYFFENQKEVDFLTDSGEAFEVKYELSKTGWEKLASSLEKIPVGKFKSLTVLTSNPQKNTQIGNIQVKFQKLSEFLY